MAKRRETNIFSLSFLDIMSCGFGAVILIYITINHGSVTDGVQIDPETMAAVKTVERNIESEKINQVELRNTLSLTDASIVTTQDSIDEVLARIRALTDEKQALTANDNETRDEIEQLKSELQSLVSETEDLKSSLDAAKGSANRAITGDGNRQYLTGLNMGGRHILVLLDTSASMLDETIVNIIRRRNLDASSQRQAPKWQRSLRIVEWITANMPVDAKFQIVGFSVDAEPAIPESANRWLAINDEAALDQSLKNLQEITPGEGSSLHSAFAALNEMEPMPDNVFLITDGLPTQGIEPPRRNLIEAQDRLKLFQSAIQQLRVQAPINVILMPMEGDPLASPSFWRLAQMTGGAFLSPAKDWP